MTRFWWLTAMCVLVAACGKDDSAKAPPPSIVSTPVTDDAAIPSPDAEAEGGQFWTFDSPQQALDHILAMKPRVMGFGELHQLEGSTTVASALSRFSTHLFVQLAPKTSDLVLETWVEDPSCGKVEKAVAKQMKAQLKRPPETESELVTLLKRAKKAGIARHVLTLGCDDYRAIAAGKEVDYNRLLGLVTEGLHDRTSKVLEARGDDDRLILVYGGSLHNDLSPVPGLEQYSYAEKISKLAEGRYVEIDLYVPELVASDEQMKSQGWYPIFEELRSESKVLLLKLTKGSYILILRENRKKP